MSYENASQIIDAWPSIRKLAEDVGATDNHIRAMRRRESIPVKFWPSLLKSAPNHGIDLSYESLVLAHAPSNPLPQPHRGEGT